MFNLSKTPKRKYKCYSLDEATFLSVKGHTPTIKTVGNLVASYEFDLDAKLNEHRVAFWSKDALISLHAWLSARQNIKNESISQYRSVELEENGILTGESYWFIQNGQVQHAIYGKSPIHKSRKLSNNFFQAKELAEAAIRK